jgi:hypothetical protein
MNWRVHFDTVARAMASAVSLFRGKPVTNRDHAVRNLGQLLAYADHLRDVTAGRMAAEELDMLTKVTFHIGLRARRILQAAAALAPREWDDILGNLSRALVESAVDLEYLHVTTTIVRGGVSRTLTPEVKADLFNTQLVIVEKDLAENLRPEHAEWYGQAVELRRLCGVKRRTTWHGRAMTGQHGIFEELIGSAEQRGRGVGRVNSLQWAYRMTSFFEHNNPNPNFYVKARPEGGHAPLETCPNDNVVGLVVIGGADVCWAWAAHLGISEEERFERLSPIIVPSEGGPKSDSADHGTDAPT